METSISAGQASPIQDGPAGECGDGSRAGYCGKTGGCRQGKRKAGRQGHNQNRGQIGRIQRDRKSTRLNSSHGYITYAVFCLKKKKKKTTSQIAYQRRLG